MTYGASTTTTPYVALTMFGVDAPNQANFGVELSIDNIGLSRFDLYLYYVSGTTYYRIDIACLISDPTVITFLYMQSNCNFGTNACTILLYRQWHPSALELALGPQPCTMLCP